MAFVKPTLNIACNIWYNSTWRTNWPLFTAPPDLVNFPCQLRGQTKQLSPAIYLTNSPLFSELVLDPLTDVRDPFFGTAEYESWMDIAEVPSGSSRWFFITGVVDQAKGFTNEYRSALLVSTAIYRSTIFSTNPRWPYSPPWPIPYP